MDPGFLDSIAPAVVSGFFGMKEQQQKNGLSLSNFNSLGFFFKTFSSIYVKMYFTLKLSARVRRAIYFFTFSHLLFMKSGHK